MGQPITVADATVAGDLAAFDADRSITGQDGVTFGSAAEAAEGTGYAAELAARIFTADAGVDHVFVASNQTVVRRDGGWDDSTLRAVAAVIEGFFVIYLDD